MNQDFITIKKQVKGLIKTLTSKETINPIKACNRLNFTNPTIMGQVLEELNEEGRIIKRGPIGSKVYGVNPNYKN